MLKNCAFFHIIQYSWFLSYYSIFFNCFLLLMSMVAIICYLMMKIIIEPGGVWRGQMHILLAYLTVLVSIICFKYDRTNSLWLCAYRPESLFHASEEVIFSYEGTKAFSMPLMSSIRFSFVMYQKFRNILVIYLFKLRRCCTLALSWFASYGFMICKRC